MAGRVEKLTKSKIAMIMVGVFAIIMAVWIVVFPVILHKNDVKGELQAYFLSATGMRLEIQGETEIEFLPLPHLSLSKLYVVNSANPAIKDAFLLKIAQVEIWPAFSSLFGNKILMNKVVISGVDLDLEELSGGLMNWQDVSSYGQKNAPAKLDFQMLKEDSVREIKLVNAHIMYSSAISNNGLEFSNISVSFKSSSSFISQGLKTTATAGFDCMGDRFALSMQEDGGIADLMSAKGSPIKVTMSSGKDAFSYDGTASYNDNKYLFNGAMQLSSGDIARMWNYYHGNIMDKPDADYKKLPLTITTKVAMHDTSKASFSDILLDGGVVKGTASAEFTLPGKLDITAALSELDLETLAENGFFFNPNSAKPKSTDLLAPPDINNSLETSLNLTIADMTYNNQHIKNARMSADIADGELTIPDFFAVMPGNTHMAFAGIGKDAEDGLTFEGQIDAQGENFVDAVGLFKTQGIALPREDFKRFHFRTTALMSHKKVRLSEFIARIENISASGGVLVGFNDHPNPEHGIPALTIEATLAMRGLNLDHMGELWGLTHWQNLLTNYNKLGSTTDGAISVWLKHLGYGLSLNTSLEDYVMGGRSYAKSSFLMTLNAKNLQFEAKKVPYYDSIMSGKVKVDVSRDTPEIDITAAIDKLDAENIFADFKPIGSISSATASKLSTDQFDLKFLDLLNSKYDLKIGQLKYKTLNATNVNLIGSIRDQAFNLEDLKGTIGGATVLGRLLVTGGPIPTLSIAMNLNSLRIEDLAPYMPILSNASGLCNIILQLNTNGANQASWINNLQGSAGIRGRDVMVHGFNLPGIIQAVSYVRTVADVLNAVKRSFPKGNTLFSYLEGEWTVSKGVVETTSTKVVSPQADGTFASKINILNGTTNTAISLALKALNPKVPPVIIIWLRGDVNAPTLDFDTSQLEQYVNNKTSEKILENQ